MMNELHFNTFLNPDERCKATCDFKIIGWRNRVLIFFFFSSQMRNSQTNQNANNDKPEARSFMSLIFSFSS